MYLGLGIVGDGREDCRRRSCYMRCLQRRVHPPQDLHHADLDLSLTAYRCCCPSSASSRFRILLSRFMIRTGVLGQRVKYQSSTMGGLSRAPMRLLDVCLGEGKWRGREARTEVKWPAGLIGAGMAHFSVASHTCTGRSNEGASDTQGCVCVTQTYIC